MLTRRQFAFAVALQARRRPSVLFILCDQWRRQSLPGAGGLKVPNLARLTREGVEFPRAYAANPMSGPSRAALQTGRYPHAVSMPWNGKRLPLEYPCLADAFAADGYETGYIGKWELDEDEPRRRGFKSWEARGLDGDEPERQTDLALDFLRRNGAKPFLLFLSYGPARMAERHKNTYEAEGIALRENVPAALVREASQELAGYNGLCSSIDDTVGRLLKGLADGGLEENTLVVFTSDHGEMLRSHGLDGAAVWYEESAGVPLLMRWPGRLAAGTQQDWLLNNIDIAPTLRGMCGLPPLEGAQGEDRSPLILNGGKGERPESVYLQGELATPREWRTVIRGWDKLVVDRELRPTHLYNLAQDPFEKDDQIIDRATRRRQEELLALMRRWIIKTADRVPYPAAVQRERQKK